MDEWFDNLIERFESVLLSFTTNKSHGDDDYTFSLIERITENLLNENYKRYAISYINFFFLYLFPKSFMNVYPRLPLFCSTVKNLFLCETPTKLPYESCND